MKTLQKFQKAATEFERVLKDAGFHPILIGSVARSYTQKLNHAPKDIDFVVCRDGYSSAKLYAALWEHRGNSEITECSHLVTKREAKELKDNPLVEIGEEYCGKVEIWVKEFQPIYNGIHIDLFKEYPS